MLFYILMIKVQNVFQIIDLLRVDIIQIKCFC